MTTHDDAVHATWAARFRLAVTPRGPDSGAFSTWTEVRNGPTDAATPLRRPKNARARERNAACEIERGTGGRKRE